MGFASGAGADNLLSCLNLKQTSRISCLPGSGQPFNMPESAPQIPGLPGAGNGDAPWPIPCARGLTSGPCI